MEKKQSFDDSASNSGDIGLHELLDGTNGACWRHIEVEDEVVGLAELLELPVSSGGDGEGNVG